MDTEQLIRETLEEALADIAANLESTRTNASGRTSASMEVETYEGGARLLGRGYFDGVELGRPAGSVPSNFNAIIEQWIRDKMARGWFSLKLIPYKTNRQHKHTVEERSIMMAAGAIAHTIQSRGTSLYRSGGRTDIYSDTLDSRVEGLRSKLSDAIGITVKEDIINRL